MARFASLSLVIPQILTLNDFICFANFSRDLPDRRISLELLQSKRHHIQIASESEYQRIVSAAEYGSSLGLHINAGHGLHYQNVAPIVGIPQLVELNIGHSIIAQALFDGLFKAVSDMHKLMN